MIHRDEVHGDIRYDRLAVALLDTDQLQRLGRVYQLGFSHLVYRSGTHTRLSHSMGAYLMASRLVTGLQRNYETETRPKGAIAPELFLPCGSESKRPAPGADPRELLDHWTVLRHLVGWAALLHDAGHIPVGHTLEDEFEGIYESHDTFTSPRLRHIWLDDDSEIRAALLRRDLYPAAFGRVGIDHPDHVLKAVMLICAWKEKVDQDSGTRTTFESILEAARASSKPGIAAALLGASSAVTGTVFSPYMADIVANTISADYLDYLRRDPHNLGLDVLRDERVASRFWIGRDENEQARMALSLVDRRGKRRLDTCTSVVELVRQRFRFAEIVYYQKTKVAASAMLAKVFELLEKPDEIPDRREPPTILDTADRVAQLFDGKPVKRREAKEALEADATPTSLLDPEVGDESLGFLLRDRALAQLDRAFDDGDEQSADRAVRSMSLLGDLARRRLYKTAFTMDAQLLARIAECDPEVKGTSERAVEQFISTLRGDSQARSTLEEKMSAIAGWPAASMLIYVPGRQSQAKGIETGALDRSGQVVTLGMHAAVRDEVQTLRTKYRDLWRCVVVAHPDLMDRVADLSEAVDLFIREMFPQISGPSRALLDEACWFPYLEPRERPAARELATFTDRASRNRWDALAQYRSRNPNATERQHALAAAVLAEMELPLERALELVEKYGSAEQIESVLDARASARIEGARREGGRHEETTIREEIKGLAAELRAGGRLFNDG